MKITIDIDETRYKDTQRIADVQQSMEHFKTVEQIIANEKPLNQESCEDCVSRGKVAEQIICWIESGEYKYAYASWYLAQRIKDLPSAKPKPKTGHWILLDECGNSGYYCSECQKKVVKEGWSDTVKRIKYCPNCGCRMIEPKKSEG